MLPVVLLGLGFALVCIGSFADLRWREVPDWSNYVGIAAALLIRLAYSLGTGSWSWILAGVFGFISMYVLASALFYLGQWGGGDSKLLMALGAIFGLGFGGEGYLGLFGGPKLLGAFLINLLLFGGLWGAFWSLKLAVKKRAAVRDAFFNIMKKSYMVTAKTIICLSSLCLILLAFAFQNPHIRFPMIIVAVTILITFYTYAFAKSIEKVCFVKDINPQRLEEGDWIQHDIYLKGKRVCGPADLGVSKSQIKKLVTAGRKNVMIKEGVPFVPSFFFAYLATIYAGNVLFAIVGLV